MATQKRSSSGKRTTTGKKTTAGGRRAAAPKKRPIRREVGGVVCLVLALCIAFSYFQQGGWLLDQPAALCRGLVGYGYYTVAPVLLLVSYILLFHRGRNVTACVVGAVLLTFDVTEQAYAERNRREFTANVSHELKTPLQGIIGSAELLENGMVRPDDVPRFVGHIRSEAQRLVTLINDILRLSELDEGGSLPTEPVELLSLCTDTVKSLESAAQQRQITMTVTGEAVTVPGVRRLLTETIFNLCDNAIAYNRPGGSVTVTVEETASGPRITVADTGIGIPREAQGRVFERFYRVDKSHSSGGTGLGLSIVKHGAAYLGARVELESEPGRGSTFTLTFPPVKA